MIRFARLSQGQARAEVAVMVGNPKWDTSDGLADVDGIIGAGVGYLASDDNGPLMVIVVEQVQRANGRELVVRVARQVTASGDATERVLPHIEACFGVGCDAVTIHTRRAGLVRKLARQGYNEAATIMRKKL